MAEMNTVEPKANKCPKCGVDGDRIATPDKGFRFYPCGSYSDPTYHQSPHCVETERDHLLTEVSRLEKRNDWLEDVNRDLANENAELREARRGRLV